MKYIIYTILLTIIIHGCSKDREGSQIEFHPIEERIPYWGHAEQKVIEKNIPEEEIIDGLTEIIISGKRLLSNQSFNEYFVFGEFQEMNLPLLSDYWVQVESIDENRVALFDIPRQQIYEYDIDSNSWYELAQSGPGPGELSFAHDMVVKRDSIYIISQDSKITILACDEVPCKFSHVINLDDNVQPVSIDTDNAGYVVMGNKVSGRNSDVSIIDHYSIFRFDKNGNLIRSFSRIYDAKGHWILLEPFTRGKIRTWDEKQIKVQYFDYFPLIYTYGDSDEQPVNIFRIEHFSMIQQMYEPRTMGLWVPEEDYSIIDNLVLLNSGYFLLTVLHRREIKLQGTQENRIEFIKDFYLFNPDYESQIFLGSLSNTSVNDLFFTKYHIINRSNSIYEISNIN